jgi:hypothetical protein
VSPDSATLSRTPRFAGEEPSPAAVGAAHEESELPSLLAALLVEFDPFLADEVCEHLEARAEHWNRTAGPAPPAAKSDMARRYLALAHLIRSRSATRALPRS